MKNNRIGILASLLVLLVPAAAATYAANQQDLKRKSSPEAAKLAPLFKSGDFKDDKGHHLPYRYFEPAAKNTERQDSRDSLSPWRRRSGHG